MAIKPQEDQKKDVADAPAAPETPGQDSPDASKLTDSSQPAAKSKKPIFLILAVVLVLVGVVFGGRYWMWSQSHVSTDDAEISSDLAQISPQVTGTVTHVLVLDNEYVKPHQLLVQLDPSTYQVALDQAKANLDESRAAQKGAVATVGLTTQSTGAEITQAQGGVLQADAGIQSAYADLAKANAAVETSKAQAFTAEANVNSARENYRSVAAAEHHAVQALEAAKDQAKTAAAVVSAARAQVRSNQSAAGRARRDAARYQTLYAQGAISASVADQAASAAEVATAQLQASQDAVTQALANLQSMEANVAGAQSQVDASRALVQQAQAGISAAKGQYSAALDSVRQSIASRAAYSAAISTARGKLQTAQGQLTQARTAPRQVSVSKASAGQAAAKIETAEAEYENAKINLLRTSIYAPVAGRVSRKTVTIGNLVSPGTPLMSIIPNELFWVIANFKETQLTHVKVGQAVDVEVDAFPGRTFHGRVNSLSAGTGSTFALLPPDNATGNFTKVVQRVPVKITLTPGQPDLERLTVGMSVTATIDTGSR